MVSSKFSLWWKNLLATKWLILFAIFLLILANFLAMNAGSYVDNVPSAQSSSDLILDNIGPYDVSIIFVWFFIIVCYAYYLYPLIYEPRKLYYYTIFSAFLIMVRAGFIVLTHLKAPPEAIPFTYPIFFNALVFSNDLFFSGHTSFPFLGFLLFKNKWIKGFMLASTFIMAASALLMHQHYSIDVFAAFFITYGVYKIGNKIFTSLKIKTP